MVFPRRWCRAGVVGSPGWQVRLPTPPPFLDQGFSGLMQGGDLLQSLPAPTDSTFGHPHNFSISHQHPLQGLDRLSGHCGCCPPGCPAAVVTIIPACRGPGPAHGEGSLGLEEEKEASCCGSHPSGQHLQQHTRDLPAEVPTSSEWGEVARLPVSLGSASSLG